MKIRSASRLFLACLAMVGIVVPQSVYAVDPTARPVSVPSPVIKDVALDATGQLRGQLLDSKGAGVSASTIQLRQDDKKIAAAKTDREGRFVLPGLRAGVYQVTAEGTNRVYRVWTGGSAPPAAESSILLVRGEQVVRGQVGPWGKYLLMGGLLITAGVIGGVIGYNVRDVDSASSRG